MTNPFAKLAPSARALNSIEMVTAQQLNDRNSMEAMIRGLRPKDLGHDLIRLGSKFDGGYLLPNDLEGIEACFSPGVADDSNFEFALAERGIRCFMADASVEKPALEHPLFDFEKKFLGPATDKNKITLTDWINAKIPKNTGDLILQMDIEGAEYSTLISTPSDTLKRFRIAVIEFHGVDRLMYPEFSNRWSRVMNKIRQNFKVAHIHVNNCCPSFTRDGYTFPRVMEFTFLRKDRVALRPNSLQFPHPLDAPNLKDQPDIVLPKCWQTPPRNSFWKKLFRG